MINKIVMCLFVEVLYSAERMYFGIFSGIFPPKGGGGLAININQSAKMSLNLEKLLNFVTVGKNCLLKGKGRI